MGDWLGLSTRFRATAVNPEKPPNSAPPLKRHRRQRVVLREAVGEGRVGGGDGAVGQHQAAVEVALGGGRQAAVEFLAQQARLLARPFGGEQDVAQLGVAQQQAPLVVDEQGADEEGVFLRNFGVAVAAQLGEDGPRSPANSPSPDDKLSRRIALIYQ
jgi:hypothetical protein